MESSRGAKTEKSTSRSAKCAVNKKYYLKVKRRFREAIRQNAQNCGKTQS